MKDTRSKLLQAATEMFSKYGFEATSTRALAQKAQVNLAAITYYFGDKMDLYKAVLDSVVDEIKETTAKKVQLLKDLAEVQQKNAAEALSALHKTIEYVIDLACGSKKSADAVSILSKEMSEPTESYNRVYTEIVRPFYQTMNDLVAKIVGTADSLQTGIIAQSIMGQLTVFRTQRDAFLRYAGLKKYNAGFLEQIKKAVIAQTDAILTAYKKENPFAAKA